MKQLLVVLVVLLVSAAAWAQVGNPTLAQSERYAGTLTAQTPTAGSTVSVKSTAWATASVTASGTYAGVTVVFEASDDGTNWYSTPCTRRNTPLQERSSALATNSANAWNCSVYGSIAFRVRASAYGSGTTNVGIIMSGAMVEPAPTVSAIIASTVNPCMSPGATLLSVYGVTTGDANAHELVALSGTTKIYVCSAVITAVSGTTPTQSLQFGTGAACATGTSTFWGPTASLTAGTITGPNYPFAVSAAGQALCYKQAGTSPVANYTITYVQQ